MSSSRLPGKSVLPVGGHPAAVLCARRAASRRHEVVVATSVDQSDDPLVAALADAGIVFVRGPLNDVLERFNIATADLPPDALVVRLTADNMLPDGSFIASLVDELTRRNVDYFATKSPFDGLPYGMSGEIFSAGLLRKAAAEATSQFDREHVTPWMVRNSKMSYVDHLLWLPADMSHLRVTIDNLRDYTVVADLFSAISDPVAVPWQELCQRMQERSGMPDGRVPWKVVNGDVHAALTLGTAQLGMPYGAANVAGLPSDAVSREIIELAIDEGVITLDCARAYGLAEKRIGRILQQGSQGRISVITKLSPLTGLPADANEVSVIDAVDASVFRSCVDLRLEKLNVLLLHNWQHRYAFNGAIWRRLLDLRDEGYIERLGASVYTPEAAHQALEDPDINYIQLPFNILDWRWKATGFWKSTLRRKDMVIHSRSALLQGLLAAPADKWPDVPGIEPAEIISKLDDLARSMNRENRLDLCLAYVRGISAITSVVLGMETMEQLKENLRLFRLSSLSPDECEAVDDRLGRVNAALLDPSTWHR